MYCFIDPLPINLVDLSQENIARFNAFVFCGAPIEKRMEHIENSNIQKFSFNENKIEFTSADICAWTIARDIIIHIHSGKKSIIKILNCLT